MLRITLTVFILSLVLGACQKPDEYPIIPAIEFKEIYSERDTGGYDQDVVTVINFTDGDGDLGYYPAESGKNDPIFDDTSSVYYYNYHVIKYQMVNGQWRIDSVADDGSRLQLGGRISYLTPTGKNKALKGEIRQTVSIDVGLRNDTFKYDIFIYDRALHKSNVVTTDAVVLTSR
jgi:hypothetical protein